MCIMHKSLKQKNIKMDLSKSKETINTTNSTTTHFTDITATFDMTEDKQFTAEHILQLCKFLAEKSKRNKILQRQLQNPRKIKKTNFFNDEYEGLVEANITACNTIPLLPQQNTRLKLTTMSPEIVDRELEEEEATTTGTTTTTTSAAAATFNILTDRLKSTTNVANCIAKNAMIMMQNAAVETTTTHTTATSSAITQTSQLSTCSQQHYQCKRDILQKIRNQIFERKRQRQLAHVQQRLVGVWRPW